MTDSASEPDVPPSVDPTVVHSARVWNYWLGGKDNYAADREAGDQVRASFPEIVDHAREGRAFLQRAVTHLAGEAGVRQFLDLGTGMPTANNTHEVAQAVAPESAIVYVDNDPLILAHANALLVGSPEGMTDYIHADIREPDTVIEAARQRLDFTRPIGLMMMGILGHLTDAPALVRRFVTALPPGSYFTQYDSVDTSPGLKAALDSYNESAPLPYYLRSPEEIEAFYEGLEVVEPGIVPCPLWRPEPTEVGAPKESDSRCGIGRKPS